LQRKKKRKKWRNINQTNIGPLVVQSLQTSISLWISYMCFLLVYGFFFLLSLSLNVVNVTNNKREKVEITPYHSESMVEEKKGRGENTNSP